METKPTSPLLLTAAALLVVFAAGLFALRYEGQTQLNTQMAQQHEALDRLEKKIAALENQTAEIAARPTPDMATIDALRSETDASKTTLSLLEDRLDALEKKPALAAAAEPAKPAPDASKAVAPTPVTASFSDAVKSGAPYQSALDIWLKDHPEAATKMDALRTSAATGLPTDATLRAQLRALLSATNEAPTAAPSGMIERINRRFAGLISIKKQSTEPAEITALRHAVDSETIEALTARIAQLPTEAQARFGAWRELVKTRDTALAELVTVTAANTDKTP